MGDYNLLTETLFKEGYDENHFPSYIHRFFKYSGGYTYKVSYVDSLVVELPCGLLAKGSTFIREMSYNGVDYCFENNNPVFICPFGKSCCQRSEALAMDKSSLCFCSGIISSKPYSYECSLEKRMDEREKAKKASFEAFKTSHKGRACEQQCKYDPDTDTWQQCYKPSRCLRNGCSRCVIKDADIDFSKKGNIYYDLECTTTCTDGSLFDGQKTVTVTKGIPFYERTYPLSILEDVVQLESEDIIRKVMLEKHYEMYMFPVEYRVINISAKRKVTRDLIADLEDVAAGKLIFHDSDQKRSEKEWKKKNKQLREEKAKKRLINMLMDGIVPTEPFSADYKHMITWFSKEQIEEYIRLGEEKRRRKEESKESEYVQLTIFD